MLVLSRKKDEVFVIGKDIEVKILQIDGDKIKIGITAPKEVQILRGELVDAYKEQASIVEYLSKNTKLDKIEALRKQLSETLEDEPEKTEEK